MAWYVFHPTKGRVVEAQKKGTTKKKQLWLEKATNEKFSTDFGAEENVDQTTGRILPSRENQVHETAQANNSPSRKKTVIKVNNNEIGTIEDDLTVDQAYLLASDYFREISIERSNVSEQGNQKVVTFQINSGTKG